MKHTTVNRLIQQLPGAQTITNYHPNSCHLIIIVFRHKPLSKSPILQREPHIHHCLIHGISTHQKSKHFSFYISLRETTPPAPPPHWNNWKYCHTTRNGQFRQTHKRLQRIVNKSPKIIGIPLPSVKSPYQKQTVKRAHEIIPLTQLTSCSGRYPPGSALSHGCPGQTVSKTFFPLCNTDHELLVVEWWILGP